MPSEKKIVQGQRVKYKVNRKIRNNGVTAVKVEVKVSQTDLRKMYTRVDGVEEYMMKARVRLISGNVLPAIKWVTYLQCV